MKLLDTNIFVYAQGTPHVYYEACRALVATLETGFVEYAIDVELLQEILHVYSVRGERSRGLRTFDRLLALFPAPLAITRKETVVARLLVERHQALSPRDALHAAVVLTQGLEGIVTTDRVFSEVAGLAAFDPRELPPGV